MTRNEAKKLAPVIKAFGDGNTVQKWRHKFGVCSDYDWFDDSNPDFAPGLDWRVKPRPKFRPWRAEEVPIGALVRSTDISRRQRVLLIVEVHNTTCYFGMNCSRELNNLLIDYEYSVDHGKIWLKCGVEEL